jgi:hypothetical protein
MNIFDPHAFVALQWPNLPCTMFLVNSGRRFVYHSSSVSAAGADRCNQSCIPDLYCKLLSNRRNSSPVQKLGLSVLIFLLSSLALKARTVLRGSGILRLLNVQSSLQEEIQLEEYSNMQSSIFGSISSCRVPCRSSYNRRGNHTTTVASTKLSDILPSSHCR